MVQLHQPLALRATWALFAAATTMVYYIPKVAASPVPLDSSSMQFSLPSDTVNLTETLHLDRRAPWDTTYSKTLEKGKTLWNMTVDPAKEKTQQKGDFTWEHMKAWGWRDTIETRPDIMQEKLGGLGQAFVEEGIKCTPQNCRNIRLDHKMPTANQGNLYPATEAVLYSVYNPENGAVIIYDEHSPTYRAGNPTKAVKDKLATMPHMSDLIFATLMKLTESQPALRPGLRVIFIRGITGQSQPTLNIIMEAFKNNQSRGNRMKDLPTTYKTRHIFLAPGNGKASDDSKNPFFAVLGSMNFSSIAYLLAQHQRDLGSKTIQRIAAWGQGGYIHCAVILANKGAGPVPHEIGQAPQAGSSRAPGV